MQLHSIHYKQHCNTERHWHLNDIVFERINLLVGKNGSGKSKTLNVINGLSKLLGENKTLEFVEGDFNIVFKNGIDTFQYDIKFFNKLVIEETLLLNGETLIQRDKNGKGSIKSANNSTHEFEIPLNELKANRRDKTNYPYLENLFFWANHVRHFNFSSPMGKVAFAIKDPSKNPTEFDLKNTDVVIPTFNAGK